MNKLTIDNQYILAEWRNDGKIFYYKWKGFVPGPQMRANLDLVLAEFAKRKTSLILQDLALVKAVAPDDQDWVTVSWIPRAIAAGMRKVALLTPTSIFGQMATNNVNINVKINGIDLHNQFFDDYAKAEAWLLGES
jgi:hypothetical protein